MQRKILHVDVNNAYLSWTALYMLEQGENIDIRKIPSIIGGNEARRAGIVLAKSDIAKKYGIITGETIYKARLKCPNLKVYSGNFEIYNQYSDKLYRLLSEYTNQIERFSIDECFLDMTNFLLNNNIIDKAKEISNRIKNELGFTVNIGIGNNKLLSKMASDFLKPNKVHTLFENEIKTKMWILPVKELFMIGEKTLPKLYNIGIKTIGDLAKSDSKYIISRFGKFGKNIWGYANGIDDSIVNCKTRTPKCISNSITLPRDISTIEELNKILLSLTEQIAFRLRKANLIANVVSVQLRTKDFKDFSHQKRLDIATCNTKEIYIKCKELLYEMYDNEFIRLVGMRVGNLVDKEEIQLSFFNSDKKLERLDIVLDNIKNKYGYHKITRAGEMIVEKMIGMKPSRHNF